MSEGICFVGLDVHARKTSAAAVALGSGEVRAVYEAGPTGFGLARAGRAAGFEVMVCSPGAIPRQPGDRIKTDARDALKLARLHAASCGRWSCPGSSGKRSGTSCARARTCAAI